MALRPGLGGKAGRGGEGIARAGVAQGTVGLISDSRRAVWPSRSTENAHTGNWRSGLPFFTRASLAHSLFLSFLLIIF